MALNDKQKVLIGVGLGIGIGLGVGFLIGRVDGARYANNIMRLKFGMLKDAAELYGEFPMAIDINPKTGEKMYCMVLPKATEAFKDMVRF